MAHEQVRFGVRRRNLAWAGEGMDLSPSGQLYNTKGVEGKLSVVEPGILFRDCFSRFAALCLCVSRFCCLDASRLGRRFKGRGAEERCRVGFSCFHGGGKHGELSHSHTSRALARTFQQVDVRPRPSMVSLKAAHRIMLMQGYWCPPTCLRGWL